MKRIGLLLVVLPLVFLAGCDDDTTSVGTPVAIDNGNITVGANSTEQLSQFIIGEPGQFEVTVTWSNGPADLVIVVEAVGGAFAANIGGSPLVTRMDATQALLDTSNDFAAGVVNNDPGDDADIQFTITFTPAG